MKKLLIIIGLSILTIVIIIGSMWISSNNKEVGLRNKLTGQVKVVEAYYDKLWKIISQKAQIAEQYKDAFMKVYPTLMEGRYGNEKGGALMKFIVESNPNYDVSLLKDLAQSVEAERTGFFYEQKKMTDLSIQHNDVLTKFPSSIFVGSRPQIPIKIISSAVTKKVMETGEENDIDIFKKDS